MRSVLLLPVAALLAAPLAMYGQQRAPDTLRGVVVSGSDSVPVPRQTVVLHRIGPDTGMAVDSVHTDDDGRFALPVRRAEGEVVLATARYQGVLYFGRALHGTAEAGEYRIRVYPTRSAGSDPALAVARRTVVVSREGDRLRFMDAIDVSGDSAATLVGPDGSDGVPWWRLSLPAGARDVRVLPGGVAEEAVEIGPGEVRLTAPVPATGQRVLLGYAAPTGEGLILAAGRPVARMEVLVRGEDPGVHVEGLGVGRSTRMDGRSVRRFSARDLTAEDTVRIAPGPGAGHTASGGVPSGVWIAAGIGLLLALGAAMTWPERA